MKRSRWKQLIPVVIIAFCLGSICFYFYSTQNSHSGNTLIEETHESQTAVLESASLENTTQIPATQTAEPVTTSASVDSFSFEPQSQAQAKERTQEPETDVLTKGTVYEKLMSGNFDCLGNDEAHKEEIERAYQIMTKNGTAVWRQIDINDDGTDDLLLQETYENWGNMKAIAGIFDCKEGQEKCVFWDINDYSEFMFCGATGELMYYAPHYGGVLSMEPYTHYYYDREWNRIEDYTIVAYRIEATENEPIGEDWIEAYPEMAENGDYYRLYVGEDETGKALTFEEFVEIYETEMGFAFQNNSYSPWK